MNLFGSLISIFGDTWCWWISSVAVFDQRLLCTPLFYMEPPYCQSTVIFKPKLTTIRMARGTGRNSSFFLKLRRAMYNSKVWVGKEASFYIVVSIVMSTLLCDHPTKTGSKAAFHPEKYLSIHRGTFVFLMIKGRQDFLGFILTSIPSGH